MEDYKFTDSSMTHHELREKILKGGEIAIQRLIERKRREDSYLVVSDGNGKVIKLWARDIKPKDDQSPHS